MVQECAPDEVMRPLCHECARNIDGMEDTEKAKRYDILHQGQGAKFGKNNAGAKELAGQYTKGKRRVFVNEPMRPSLRSPPTRTNELHLFICIALSCPPCAGKRIMETVSVVLSMLLNTIAVYFMLKNFQLAYWWSAFRAAGMRRAVRTGGVMLAW